MSPTEITKEFELLLKRFQQLPKTKVRPKTVLEISGYPHFENVCSNILGFFFDSNEEHGLNECVLSSLLHLVDPTLPPSLLRSLQVNREVTTESGGRLDIVIQGESLIVGIENKIHAKLYNNLEDYSNHLNNLAGRKGELRKVLKIILCLSDEDKRTSDFGFKIVTYDAFLERLQQDLGPHLLHANQHYLGLLFDFISTIKNLKRGTHMDPQHLNFFKENRKPVHEFYNKLRELFADLKAKGKDAEKHLVNLSCKPPRGFTNLQSGFFDEPTRIEPSYCIWCEPEDENSRLFGLELAIGASGWRIILWPKGDSAPMPTKEFVKNSKMDFKLGRSVFEGPEDGEVWEYKTFDYQEDAAKVVQEFCDFVSRISALLNGSK